MTCPVPPDYPVSGWPAIRYGGRSSWCGAFVSRHGAMEPDGVARGPGQGRATLALPAGSSTVSYYKQHMRRSISK